MMTTLAQSLLSIHIGVPVSAGKLTMFPLLRTDAGRADYQLLDEALDANEAEVTEISEAGSVPELLFRNKSTKDILLVDGEELVGAKQNRVLNLTILVGAGQELKIPVSCVEAGRWSWQSRRFTSSGRKLHAKGRMEKMRGVSASMRESGQRSRGDIQADVWRSVDAKMEALECRSATSSLGDIYAASEKELARVRAEFRPQPDQVGAVFAIDGEIAGAELFDAAETLAKLLAKLVDSYAFDAIELDESQTASATPSVNEVRQLLDRIAQAPASAYAAIAKGTDVRVDSAGLHAAALLDGERTVHLSAFEQPQP